MCRPSLSRRPALLQASNFCAVSCRQTAGPMPAKVQYYKMHAIMDGNPLASRQHAGSHIHCIQPARGRPGSRASWVSSWMYPIVACWHNCHHMATCRCGHLVACVPHLQSRLSGAGTLGKDLDDEAHPVQNRPPPGHLQVALLHPAQHAVHKHPAEHQPTNLGSLLFAWQR